MNFDLSLVAQLNAAATSRRLGGGEPPKQGDTQTTSNASWQKAFNGETITLQELASRRHARRECTSVALKRLERKGLVEKAGFCITKLSRKAVLWRWVDAPES